MLVFKCFLVFENQAKSLRAMTARVRADGQAFKKAHRAKRVNVTPDKKENKLPVHAHKKCLRVR